MRISKIVKLVLVAAAAAVVYLKVLDDETRETVKTTAQDAVNNVQGVVNRFSGMRPVDAETDDATPAQTWAAEQWENVGFGDSE